MNCRRWQQWVAEGRFTPSLGVILVPFAWSWTVCRMPCRPRPNECWPWKVEG